MDSTASHSDFQELKAKLEVHKTAGVVGIDVAKSKHFGVVLDPVGQTIQSPFSFSNDKAGFNGLLDRVKDLGQRHLISHWVFGFEASGGYEKPLAAYLVDNKQDVVQVNSVAVKRHREMMTGSVDKNDAKDAVSIAYLIRQGFVEYYHLRGLEEEDLAGLVLINEHLKARRTQLKLKIKQNVLKYTFPELETFCKNIESRFAMELLTQYPTPHDIVKAGKLEFKKAMVPQLRGRQLVYYLDEVYALAETSVGLKLDRWTTKALELRTYVAELRLVEQQRQSIAKRLEHLLETNEDYALLHTVPGIGPETGSAILAEIGTVSRFGSERHLLSYAGLDLVSYQSGQYQSPARISKRGRPLLRKAAYQAVNVAVISSRQNALKRKYHQILAQHGNTKDTRQKAKVKLCSKLLRVVYAVLSKREPYQEGCREMTGATNAAVEGSSS
jgi:transposase